MAKRAKSARGAKRPQPRVRREPARLAAKSVAKVAPKVATLVPEPALVPHTHPSMRKLGAELVHLHASKEREYLERCLEIGRKLRQARTRLAHGSWEPFLREVAKLAPRTASGYVALSTWADDKPRQLQRWRTLGASKLIVIATASDAARVQLSKIPTRRLADIGVPELRLLIARLGAEKKAPTVDARLARLRRRMRGVVREVHALLEVGALPDDEIEVLRDLMKEASEALHDQ